MHTYLITCIYTLNYADIIMQTYLHKYVLIHNYADIILYTHAINYVYIHNYGVRRGHRGLSEVCSHD